MVAFIRNSVILAMLILWCIPQHLYICRQTQNCTIAFKEEEQLSLHADSCWELHNIKSLVQYFCYSCPHQSAVKNCIQQPHQRVQHCSKQVTENIVQVSGFVPLFKFDPWCKYGSYPHANRNALKCIIKLNRFLKFIILAVILDVVNLWVSPR